MFEMKEEYKTNIATIDVQHERLFDIMERAYQLLQDANQENKYEKIKEIITELREYAQIHFDDEEEYMRSIDYKNIDLQIKEHREYIKYVNDFELHKIDNNEDEHIMEILNFLYIWLVKHIVKKDIMIKDENEQ